MESINSQLLALCDAAELVDLSDVRSAVADVRSDVGDPAVARDVHRRDARRDPERPTVATALRHGAPGQVIAAQHRGQRVAVALLADGRAFAVPDRCPHDGGLLSDGFLEGDQLVCARHGWEIDPCTGRCPQRPRAVIPTRELLRR